MTTITALPPAPSRGDPSTFSAKSDALLGALDTFVTETNAVALEASASAASASSYSGTASSNATTATTQAGIATTQAGIATTKASDASGYATTASGHATTATTQAGIATTKAGEANASAIAAAASAASISGGPVTSVNGMTGIVTGLQAAIGTISGLAKGNGANALTAATAETDYVTPTGSGTLTNKTLTGYTETVYALSGTALDPANGTVQTKTLGANTTFTESLVDGQSVILGITAGAYTVTWPTTVWAKVGGGGAAPTLVSTGVNWITLWQVGGTLYGSFLGTT